MGFKVKQSSLSEGSGSNLTPLQILALIKTVDGVNSGLDSDLLRGKTPSQLVLENETDPLVSNFIKGITKASDILDALNSATGTISSALLPSSVDDILNFSTFANFPVTGTSQKIYVAEDTHKVYRWSGSLYVDITSAATADEALKLTTAREITGTGDLEFSFNFDGSQNVLVNNQLAIVNEDIGSFGSPNQIPIFTVDDKGRILEVSPSNIAPTWSSITNKPSPITYLENNSTPPNWDYWLFGNFYGQYWELLPVSQAAGNNTVVLRTGTGGVVGTSVSATATTPSTSPTTGANVVAGGQGIGGNQNVGGFSSLGGVASGHPAIKMKVLGGTTAATQGGVANVAHGLTASKIVSVTVLVSVSGQWMCHSYQHDANYQFNFIVDNTNLTVLNFPTNSAGILSKTFTATIFYKE